MTKFTEYLRDLEDSFKLDCNEEDVRKDKDAKKCYKVLKKYRKNTDKYYKFLCKVGLARNFKKERKDFSMKYSSSNSNNSSGGIGFTGMLTIVFIILKLCDVIKWSWVWVLAPVWIYAIIYVLVAIIIAVIIYKQED